MRGSSGGCEGLPARTNMVQRYSQRPLSVWVICAHDVPLVGLTQTGFLPVPAQDADKIENGYQPKWGIEKAN